MKKILKETKIMKRRGKKIYFNNEDMDFNLMWVLGQASAGGAELGECMNIASRIKDSDAESWVTEWTIAAQRLDILAQEAQKDHRFISARQTYLRAFSYFHIATLSARPKDARLFQNWSQGQSCFQKAGALFERPILPIEVPFGRFPLHGYFLPSLGTEAKAPTLIYVTGGEGWAEHALFWTGAGRERGYNIVAVDLPFHVGSRLRYPDMPLTNVAEGIDAPLKSVIDYTVSRTEVDPEKVAIIGFSFGGWCAMRAAMLDRGRRIKALIPDSPIHDIYALAKAEFPPALQKAPPFVTDLAGRLIQLRNSTDAITAERSAWQFGVNSLSQMLELGRGQNVEPADIHCPTLCLASDGEAPAFLSQAREFYDALNVPKKLHIFNAESGADAHCQVNNLALMQEVAYDWLEVIFKK